MDGVVIIRAEEIRVATEELSEAFLEGYYTWRGCGGTAGNGLQQQEEGYGDGGF
ncbi:hypothetical protein HanPI659440_Chr17g0693451 [Helianthus annuus]|nr:hypothetical protein HanPI659440_Chr17g0693451 [Helianthus annuus]